MRAISAALPFLVVAASAHAQQAPPARPPAAPPPPSMTTYDIVRAVVTASSTAANSAAENVLDQNVTSAWCVDAAIPGATLTIELAHPIKLDRVTVTLGVWDAHEDVLDKPMVLDVGLDDEKVQTLHAESPVAESIVLDKPGATAHKVTVRTVPQGTRVCISGISLDRNRQAQSLLRMIDDARLAELPRAIADLRAAAGACDGNRLGVLASFPMQYEVRDRYALPRERKVRRTLYNISDLMSTCRPRHFIDNGVRDIAPDTVAVWADGDWVLRWKAPGGWRLVELPEDYGVK